MTQAEFRSYRFNSQFDPSDEQLDQLMENVAEKVRKSNRESDEKFFAELNRAVLKAKERSASKSDSK